MNTQINALLIKKIADLLALWQVLDSNLQRGLVLYLIWQKKILSVCTSLQQEPNSSLLSTIDNIIFVTIFCHYKTDVYKFPFCKLCLNIWFLFYVWKYFTTQIATKKKVFVVHTFSLVMWMMCDRNDRTLLLRPVIEVYCTILNMNDWV